MEEPPPLTIVLIPGIGGHPAFHEALINALRRVAPVATWPHGDFNAAPFRGLAQHVEVWRQRIESLRASRIIVVAISFGAHIACGLPDALIARIELSILISRWPIGRFEKTFLAVFARFPPALACAALGQFLFRWSDHHSDDRNELNLLRLRLYDNRKLVIRRLRARLLCCRDVKPSIAASKQSQTYVYGDSEMSLRRDRSVFGRDAEVRRVIVKGNHAIATRRTLGLEKAVVDIIAKSMGRPPGGAI